MLSKLLRPMLNISKYPSLQPIEFRYDELDIDHHYENAYTKYADILKHCCIAYITKTIHQLVKEQTKNSKFYLLDDV